MFNKKKPQVEKLKPASQIIPKPIKYPPTPLLEHENPPAPPLKEKTVVKLPAKLPKVSKYTFFQEMLIRSGPLGQELKSGEILKLTMTYEQGLYVMKAVYS